MHRLRSLAPPPRELFRGVTRTASLRWARRGHRSIAVVLAIVVVVGCGGERRIRQESVPSVIGVDAAAAACMLAHAGLRWRFAKTSRSTGSQTERAACGGRYPAGDSVCGQRPRAGAQRERRAVVVLRTWSAASREVRQGCRPRSARPPDARVPVLDVAFEYFRTPKAGAGNAACGLLTSGERRRLARLQAGGCAATLNERLGRRLIKGRETIAVVLSLNNPARTAEASVLRMSIRGQPPIIRLRYERGTWRIFDTGIGA
jgi:hypothetical protein